MRGFTLIELSTVIVIVGLIIGGILFGIDLLESSTAKKEVSQIESLKVAASTFETKYGCLPGDCRNSSMFTGWAAINGNENGLIDAAWSNTGIEWNTFWQQLSQANLFTISCNQTSIYDYCYQPFSDSALIAVTGGPSPDCNPWGSQYRCYTNSKNRLLVFASSGYALTPTRANYYDTKLDDGRPMAGNIIARAGTSLGAGDNSLYPATPAASGNVCVLSTTPNSYYVRNTQKICNLEILNIGF